MATPETKRCQACGQWLPARNFPKHKSSKDGLHGHCRLCRNARARARWAAEPWRRLVAHERHMLRRYGVTLEEYEAQWRRQGGRCITCEEPLAETRDGRHIDHCHNTMAFRGLLCGPCNTALGLAKEKPEILRALAAYLESSNS